MVSLGLRISRRKLTHTTFMHFYLVDATVSQVAIAWLLHRPSVASVVIGARTLEQLEENLQSVNVHLSKEEVCRTLLA